MLASIRTGTLGRKVSGFRFASSQIPTPQEDLKSTNETEKPKKIVVFGGNGFVGQAIVRAGINAGLHVVSINRSGPPKNFKPPSFSQGKIEWKTGDLFAPDGWRDSLKDAVGVISCVGAFGSNEFMEKINGDANILAVSETLRAHIPRFVYISTVENNLPDFLLKGYFNGKRRTENALIDAFPMTGVVLRPGFIYGTRNIPLPSHLFFGLQNTFMDHISLPLWLLGK
jgi:uncharacterized protein YbjT (DUF2867 family)